MPNLAEKYITGRTEMTAEERQSNRDAAKRREDLRKAREGGYAPPDDVIDLRTRPGTKTDWNREKSRMKNKAALEQAMAEDIIITRKFAELMHQTLNAKSKFMSESHLDERYVQLERCISTGIMVPALQPLFAWTQKEHPEIHPYPVKDEED